ncbi:MAG: GDP-mannose 4,6-dehydratase [Candidatus Aminicenantes bacterium]|nr:GDP-mannose 4,6-dehydratase [Candidatus Aminicenantes bacterium]
MTVLITGAAGFIGSNLVDALLRRGDKVIGLDNFEPYYNPVRKRRNLATAMANPLFELVEADIRDTPTLNAVMASRCPDGIVHLAAKVGNRNSLSAADSEGYANVNTGGTTALLAACMAAPLRSLVFVSTANVYDSTAPAPFREGFTPERPRTPYSRSKQQAEALVMEAVARNGLPATVLRLFTTYGPRQRPDMVHHSFVSALLQETPLILIGAGSDLRDYLHVGDACEAIMACLDRPLAGEVVNAGSGRGTSLDMLLALLARLTGKEPLVHRQAAEAADTRLLLADISKAERLLGWKSQVGLEQGLADFVAWVEKNEFSSKKETATHEK